MAWFKLTIFSAFLMLRISRAENSPAGNILMNSSRNLQDCLELAFMNGTLDECKEAVPSFFGLILSQCHPSFTGEYNKFLTAAIQHPNQVRCFVSEKSIGSLPLQFVIQETRSLGNADTSVETISYIIHSTIQDLYRNSHINFLNTGVSEMGNEELDETKETQLFNNFFHKVLNRAKEVSKFVGIFRLAGCSGYVLGIYDRQTYTATVYSPRKQLYERCLVLKTRYSSPTSIRRNLREVNWVCKPPFKQEGLPTDPNNVSNYRGQRSHYQTSSSRESFVSSARPSVVVSFIEESQENQQLTDSDNLKLLIKYFLEHMVNEYKCLQMESTDKTDCTVLPATYTEKDIEEFAENQYKAGLRSLQRDIVSNKTCSIENQ